MEYITVHIYKVLDVIMVFVFFVLYMQIPCAA